MTNEALTESGDRIDVRVKGAEDKRLTERLYETASRHKDDIEKTTERLAAQVLRLAGPDVESSNKAAPFHEEDHGGELHQILREINEAQTVLHQMMHFVGKLESL